VNNPTRPFEIWAVIMSETVPELKGAPFSEFQIRSIAEGLVGEPESWRILAMYATEAEARDSASSLGAYRKIWPAPAYVAPYKTPLAWLVVLVVQLHSSGEGDAIVVPFYGGISRQYDEDFIVGIYAGEQSAIDHADSLRTLSGESP
jgi:hypothetical protein